MFGNYLDSSLDRVRLLGRSIPPDHRSACQLRAQSRAPAWSLTNFTRFATTILCLSTVWVVVSQLFQLAISSDRLSSYTGSLADSGTTISEVYIPDRTILAFHRLWSSFFDERYSSRMDAQMSMTDSPKIPAEKHERPHTLLHRRSRHTDFECKWTQAWK